MYVNPCCKSWKNLYEQSLNANAKLLKENAELKDDLAYFDKITVAELAGIAAALDGKNLEDNPYLDIDQREVWELGYNTEKEILALKQIACDSEIKNI